MLPDGIRHAARKRHRLFTCFPNHPKSVTWAIFVTSSIEFKNEKAGGKLGPKWARTLCILLSLLVASCDPIQESLYYKEGVGNDLYWPGLREATKLQEIYFGFLCQQAGLPAASDGVNPQCLDHGFSPAQWAIFVQTGMNDIDLRCDSYLAWLDDKRRAAVPNLQEISDVRTATANILLATGVGPNPMAVVGNAFGLASNTFTNLNARLIFQIDKSTVQALVLGQRNKYRVDIASISIPHRPAAVHALRSYLNICTPFSIETGINTTVTVYQQAGASALDSRPLITPETAYAAGLSARQRISNVRSTVGSGADQYCPILEGPCKSLTNPDVKKALLALCVPDSEAGSVTAKVQALIGVYESAVHRSSHTGRLTAKDLSVLSDKGDCKPTGLRNYFERITYKGAASAVDSWLSGQLKKVQVKNGPPLAPFPDGGTIAQARPYIETLNSMNGFSFPSGLSDQVTPELLAKLKSSNR
jgi:hypothetical protein